MIELSIKRKYIALIIVIVITGLILLSLIKPDVLWFLDHSYRVTIHIGREALKTVDGLDLAGTLSIYMDTPTRLYTYVFHVNKTNNVITLDLTEPLMKWRDFYLENEDKLVKAGERPLPTLSLFFILVDGRGNNYISSYRYSPIEYYLSKGLSYREAFSAAAKKPFEAYANKVVTVNKLQLFKVKHKPVYSNTSREQVIEAKLSPPLLTRENKSSTTINTWGNTGNEQTASLQVQYCSSYTTGYCSFIKVSEDPISKILHENMFNTPSTWYRHVNAPASYMIDRLWTTFTFRLSTTYYFDKSVFGKNYVTWFATTNLHPGLWTLDEYIHQLAIDIYGFVSPSQFRWENVVQPREVTLNMPRIAVNVTYASKKPLGFMIDVVEGGNNIKVSGISFAGLLVVQNEFQASTSIKTKTATVTPAEEEWKWFKAIAVPTTYYIEGDGIFVNYTVDVVTINNKEYWRLTPYFAFIPLVKKLYSNLEETNILTGSSSIDKEFLHNITWSGAYRTVFYGRVTEDYPVVSSGDVVNFIILRTVSSNAELVNYMGVGESVWKGLAITLLNGVLGGILTAAGLPVWLSPLASFAYAEFTAYGSFVVLRLFGQRLSLFEDFSALVRIDKLTMPLLVRKEYLPLIIMYRVVVDDTAHITPLSSGGSGTHYEDLEKGVMKARAVAVAPYSSTSTSWLKYKLVVNTSGVYQLTIPIRYSYNYGFTSSNTLPPEGAVYLEEEIFVVDENGNTVYSWTITLFADEEHPPQPPNIPSPLAVPPSTLLTTVKEYLFAKNITLNTGVYYLIVKTIAHAEAENGEAYIDAYTNGYYVQVNPTIRDIT